MDFNNTSSPGDLSNGKGNPNYFLIYLGFLVFCPLFYIIYRFIKLFCFPTISSPDAIALPSTVREENPNVGVYVIDIDLIEGIIRNSEVSVESESDHWFTTGSATPYESFTGPSVPLHNQITKTCPTYGELYDLDCPPPTYEECEAKNFSSTSIPEKTKTPPGGDKASIFSRSQFEQLYRNLIYFAFYMFYRLKNSI